jgi:exodeoxyribonuclease VII small subunit
MSQSDPQPESSPCFEEALRELEVVVHDLEEGQIGLAEALARYEKGIGLLKHCYGLLENAQRRIELLTGVDANGNPVTTPFEDSAGANLEEKAQNRGQRRSPPPESRRRGSGEVDSPAGLF